MHVQLEQWKSRIPRRELGWANVYEPTILFYTISSSLSQWIHGVSSPVKRRRHYDLLAKDAVRVRQVINIHFLWTFTRHYYLHERVQEGKWVELLGDWLIECQVTYWGHISLPQLLPGRLNTVWPNNCRLVKDCFLTPVSKSLQKGEGETDDGKFPFSPRFVHHLCLWWTIWNHKSMSWVSSEKENGC